ncbi:MAG: helix-turn-helix domain-containing protein [Hyphomonadaceae bacterium]
MTFAGNKLIGAAKEARAIARGEKKPISALVPSDVDVKKIRKDLGLSQEAFAHGFGFSVGQIRDWEQNRCRPIGAMRAYLLIILKNPDMVAKAFSEFAAENKASEDSDKLIAL